MNNTTIERTTTNRMTDMYILRLPGLTNNPVRHASFTKFEWGKMYPELVLKRGEKRKICLTFDGTDV